MTTKQTTPRKPRKAQRIKTIQERLTDIENEIQGLNAEWTKLERELERLTGSKYEG